MTGARSVRKPPFGGIAALSFGLHTITRHPIFFLVTAAAADLLGRALLLLQPTMPAHPGLEDLQAYVPGMLLAWLIYILTGIAYINVALACSKDRAPAFAGLWPGAGSVLRFARTSVSYGFMTVLLYFAAGQVGAIGYVLYLELRKGDPLTVWVSGFGAAMLAVSFLVGRWLVDRQFFGHLIVDQGLGGNAALRASVPMARLVRSSLLTVTVVSLGIAATFGAPRMMLTDYGKVPRPFGIPHIGKDWPPAAISTVDDALIVLQTLGAWLGVLALTFVYRAVERWLAPAPASSASEGGVMI